MLVGEQSQHASFVRGVERVACARVHPAAAVWFGVEFVRPDDPGGQAPEHDAVDYDGAELLDQV